MSGYMPANLTSSRAEKLAAIRADRLQRGGMPRLSVDVVRRSVIATQRLAGIDARQWVQPDIGKAPIIAAVAWLALILALSIGVAVTWPAPPHQSQPEPPTSRPLEPCR